MAAFEFTSAGLDVGRFPEARALVVQKWKARFGDDVLTSPDTPDGLIIDVLAIMVALAWEGIADVYANSFFRTSVGQSLDWILDLFGRRRGEATPSTAVAYFYGQPSATVPVESIAGVASTLVRFDTNAEVTTRADAAGVPLVIRVLEVTSGNTYEYVNGFTGTHTVVAGPSDTPSTVAQALVDDMNAGALTAYFPGLDPDGNAVIVLTDGVDGAGSGLGSSTSGDEIELLYAAAANLTALETGALEATAGNLNRLESTIANIVGVINVADADVGSDIETDAEYRATHLDRIDASQDTTRGAIRSAVLDATDPDDDAFEIEYCRVFNNPTDAVDARGVPANSFETVWIGPAGTDAEDIVAAAILSKAPIGIRSYGSITTNVEDEAGDLVAVGHSRGTELYLHLEITITAGEGYPSVGDPLQAIADAVLAYLTDGGEGELGLGDDLIRYRLATPINATVPGVANAAIRTSATAAPGDPPSWSSADVSVDPDTILRVDSSRITVF